MSIVRWIKQKDGNVSDVYIFWDCDGGITCMSSIDDARDFNVDTPEQVILKLKEEFKDHNIPEHVFDVESYK